MYSTAETQTGDATSSRRSGPLPPTKRIAICSVGELFGGVERHILGLLNGLQSRDVEPLLLLFHDGELASQARDQGVLPVILPDRKWSMWSATRQLVEILKQRQIEIVHVHGYKATVCAALARQRHVFAIVKTEHGLPEPMAGRPLHALRERFYRYLDAWAARATGASVCYVSDDLMAYYQNAHAGLQRAVIPNGISIVEAGQCVRPPEFRSDRFKMVMVGRLDTVKGHHVAIDALARIGDRPDVELFLIGTGPSESQLRALAEHRGVAGRIHFLGFRRNAYDYIAHCDALLMPSLHEGLPYTLLEAMAFGTPIVASRVGGLAEVLQDGLSGLLIPPGDATALAKAVVALLDDQELRQRLGRHAQQLQRTRYSLEVMTDRYLAVYESLWSLGHGLRKC